MKNLKQVIITRDNITSSQADAMIADALEEFNKLLAIGDTESAYEICSDHFGLEPDFLADLIG